jgi:hypothetical protein
LFAEVPAYIKNALNLKNQYKVVPRQRKRTFRNLTMKEVLDKVKGITRALNQHAKKNGYKVDYKLRMLK